MPPDNRLPSDDPSRERLAISPPFCRVERRDSDGKVRHFVVHTQSPKFLVEFERAPISPSTADASAAGKATSPRPVIRRVCVPNSWAGDYHRCARQLGAASDFFTATEAPDA